MDNPQLTQAASEFQKTDITIGKTQFRIRKMLVMDAFHTLEIIRFGLGERLGQLQNLDSIGDVILKIVFSAPLSLINEVRGRLFENMLYKRPPEVKDFVPLAGSEETAFEKLPPIAVYEMIVRGLSVNFFDSMTESLSRFGLDLQDSAQPNHQTSIFQSPEQSIQN